MLYSFAKAVLFILFHFLYRIKAKGIENIPVNGGFVMCANHVNACDPIFIAISMKRSLHFMAKKELFQNRFLRFLFTHIHAFPVDRSNVGMSTLKAAVRLLKEGKCLLIFSQGTRMKEIDVTNAKAGAALFAIKAGVPVVPVGIRSSFRFFQPVNIRFGEPISFETYRDKRLKSEDLNGITSSIMEKVKSLAELEP